MMADAGVAQGGAPLRLDEAPPVLLPLEEDLRAERDRLQALVGHQRMGRKLHRVDGDDLRVEAVGERRTPVTGVRRIVGAIEPDHHPVRRPRRPHPGTGVRRRV
jgi:hypothetical protein